MNNNLTDDVRLLMPTADCDKHETRIIKVLSTSNIAFFAFPADGTIPCRCRTTVPNERTPPNIVHLRHFLFCYTFFCHLHSQNGWLCWILFEGSIRGRELPVIKFSFLFLRSFCYEQSLSGDGFNFSNRPTRPFHPTVHVNLMLREVKGVVEPFMRQPQIQTPTFKQFHPL